MPRRTSCPRLRSLAVGVLLVAVSGCGGCTDNESAAPTDGASAGNESGAVMKSPPLAVGATPVAAGLLKRMTPNPSGETPQAGPDYDVLSIDAQAEPDTGGAPLTVSFTAKVHGGPPGLRYRWEFGDDTPPRTSYACATPISIRASILRRFGSLDRPS